jgi:hypothetical protein
VAFVLVNRLSSGEVARRQQMQAGMPISPRASFLALPPSIATSGFKGDAGSQVAGVLV